MKLLLVLVLSIGACGLGCSRLGGGNAPPGLVTAYQPVTSYDRIRRDCGSGCKLLKMEAKKVASDGTMDLTGDALVRYEFRNTKGKLGGNKKDKKKKSTGSSGPGSFEQVTITVPKVGGSRSPGKMVMDRTVRPFNVKISRATTVIGPECKMSELWKSALQKGADQKDLATVTYDRDGYLFEIEGKSISLMYDLQCKPLWAPAKLVRPVQDYPGVASIAPKGAEFTGLTARQVRSDGAVDTSADPAWVRYTFFWTEPLKRTEEVEIMLRGGELRKSRTALALGAKPKGIAPPRCKFADLWQTALKNKANKDQTARITYEGNGYRFRQESPLLALEFDLDCQLKK